MQKEALWQWQHKHDTAFEKVKELVTQATLLIYYNPDEELTVHCDASNKGLGAALMQNGQPVTCLSMLRNDISWDSVQPLLKTFFLTTCILIDLMYVLQISFNKGKQEMVKWFFND